MPSLHYRFAPSGGGLTEDGDDACRPLPVLLCFAFLDLERIEAAAPHEQVLVAKHVADGPDLAGIAVALAQPARVGIGAAVGKGRERQGDDAEMIEAFRTADEVVTQGIMSVSEIINVPGEINVDFADVRTILSNPGGALMAIGTGHGHMGALEAAKQAIANPLLDISIKGAKGVLFSVKGGEELTLGGVNAAGELISKSVSKDADIYFGMSIEDDFEDRVSMTLIATGLKQDDLSKAISSKGGAGGMFKSGGFFRR